MNARIWVFAFPRSDAVTLMGTTGTRSVVSAAHNLGHGGGIQLPKDKSGHE